MVDGQKPVKAISLATNPTKDGERLGHLILDTMKGVKRKMKKVKEFLEKFKGYIFTTCLGILTIIELCGGFLNQLFKGVFCINGVEIIPIITLVCAIVVGCLSNSFSKEDWEKIKALFAKKTTNELVLAEIKKQLKDNNLKLADTNKKLSNQEAALANLNSELDSLKNTYEAKQQMRDMVPQLATDDDVQVAYDAVTAKIEEITLKQNDISITKNEIGTLTTVISALKNQL